MVSAERAQVLRQDAVDLSSIDLTQRQECDLELLLSGAFSPLTGFMDQETYDKPELSVSAGGKERFLE